MNKRGNILLIILVAAGILAASVGGYFWWSSKNSVQEFVLTKTVETKPVDETGNWKIYKNVKYGFETKYNSNLDLTERGGDSETSSRFGYLQIISFGTNPIKGPYSYEIEISKKSLGDYQTEIVRHIADKIDSVKDTLINGTSWIKITYKIFLITDYVSVTKAVANDKKYSHAVTAATLDIDQILSTFKFL